VARPSSTQRGVLALSSPEYRPYHISIHDNVLDERTEVVLPRDVIARQGTTLGRLLALHPLTIEVHHGADGGLDSLRTAARNFLAAKGHFVIVNICEEQSASRAEAISRRLPLTMPRPIDSALWMWRATNIHRSA
jgi:hypothetical protein